MEDLDETQSCFGGGHLLLSVWQHREISCILVRHLRAGVLPVELLWVLEKVLSWTVVPGNHWLALRSQSQCLSFLGLRGSSRVSNSIPVSPTMEPRAILGWWGPQDTKEPSLKG